jgi:hypothetical protein
MGVGIAPTEFIVHSFHSIAKPQSQAVGISALNLANLSSQALLQSIDQVAGIATVPRDAGRDQPGLEGGCPG